MTVNAAAAVAHRRGFMIATSKNSTKPECTADHATSPIFGSPSERARADTADHHLFPASVTCMQRRAREAMDLDVHTIFSGKLIRISAINIE
jgi:hypothetical protein